MKDLFKLFVACTSWKIPEHRWSCIFDCHPTQIFESFQCTIWKPTFTLIKTNAEPYLKTWKKLLLSRSWKIPAFESLFNKAAGLLFCNFIETRFQRRCFFVNIAKFLKRLILKKIWEQLLLNNIKRNLSSMKTVKGC